MIEFMIVSLLYLLIAFAFIMKLKYKLDGTRFESLALLVVVPFIICDWLWNIIFGTIIFLDPPKEWFFELGTKRMKRYKKLYLHVIYEDLSLIEKWRLNFAVRLCIFLNQHDKEHC